MSCLDVDECKLGLHTCNKGSEVCDNTRGSYKCLARSLGDGRDLQPTSLRSLRGSV